MTSAPVIDSYEIADRNLAPTVTQPGLERGYEFEPETIQRSEVPDVELEGDFPGLALGAAAGSEGLAGIPTVAPAQLNPELGPLDLGYPLLIDFGAGEAPHDDGVAPIFAESLTRGGFSDSILQASWRRRWTDASMIHGTVAVSRYQDIGMMDGARDMRFSWFVVGWKFSY